MRDVRDGAAAAAAHSVGTAAEARAAAGLANATYGPPLLLRSPPRLMSSHSSQTYESHSRMNTACIWLFLLQHASAQYRSAYSDEVLARARSLKHETRSQRNQTRTERTKKKLR